MSTSPPAESGPEAPATRRSASRAQTVVAWIFQIAGAGLFLFFGFGKVTGSNAAAVETFNQIGLGDWFRVTIGALEMLGAIGLLIPIVAGLAAVCLAILTIGATVVTLALGAGSVTAPLMCFAVVTVVAILRRRTILSPFVLVRQRLTGSSSRAADGNKPIPGGARLAAAESDGE